MHYPKFGHSKTTLHLETNDPSLAEVVLHNRERIPTNQPTFFTDINLLNVERLYIRMLQEKNYVSGTILLLAYHISLQQFEQQSKVYSAASCTNEQA